jgi:hypothetical protein
MGPYRRILRLAATAALGLSCLAVPALAPGAAWALPIASGANCSSSWVNNAGAMACFIQGEEETRAGFKHPHYVACAGGDIFCCVDNDAGAQDCVAQAKGRPATQADWIRAILASHRTMVTRLGRYSSRSAVAGAKATVAPAH